MLDARREMVRTQMEARGIRDQAVLAAMRTVPRHEFVPESMRSRAYDDRPLPIGRDQTISQPYIVAYMTQLAEAAGAERVLEIGTGSGYQAAVLAELAGRVYTVEIVEPLLRRSAATLLRLAYRSVLCRFGDGGEGWSGLGPYDAILVTAAAERRVPPALLDQLKDGGRLVAPVGGKRQSLRVVRRHGNRFVEHEDAAVRFVPLVGGAAR